MPMLRVHYLPQLVAEADLAGSTCVVVDVLRATTTMVYALAAGASSVLPCLTIDDARNRAARLPAEQAVLGGERGGVRIPGFALGNSPAEYTPETVAGKTIVLTTTNGTRALLHCHQSAEVWIGAFVNLSAVCAALSRRQKVDLLCAGTDGEITREDVLFAGAVAEHLATGNQWQLNDQAALARDAWLQVADSAAADLKPRLDSAMRASKGGRNLMALNMGEDIELAADVDRFALVPQYHAAAGRIEGSQGLPPTGY